jgi:hypothetical protein
MVGLVAGDITGCTHPHLPRHIAQLPLLGHFLLVEYRLEAGGVDIRRAVQPAKIGPWVVAGDDRALSDAGPSCAARVAELRHADAR